MESRIARRTAFLATALLALPLAITAQEEDFHRAYFLHHEEGRLAEAQELYQRVASNRNVSPELRERAKRYAAEVGEDLVASDLARLMPGDPIAYIGCMDPGRKLNSLLGQLGLLVSGQTPGAERLGISPLLLEGALGLRGAALAITDIDPSGGPPEGVLILHAGDMDIVRGLIETAVSMGGQAAEPIEGHPTWLVEDHAYVTTTARLVIVSAHRDQIEDVLARLAGDDSDSLARSGALDDSLAVRDGLFSFCVRAEPVMPMIQGLLHQQAQHDPELGMALAVLDVGSLRSLSGLVDVDDDGVSFELSLRLAEGHKNLAFNLLRMPNLDRGTLELVPRGAAFFMAGAVNPQGQVPAGLDGGNGAPVVTAMDFGREIFGNLVDYAIFGLPPAHDSQAPIEIAAILRSNDIQRSRAIWDLVFTCATQFAPPEKLTVAGVPIVRHSIQGMPVYLGSKGNRIVIGSSPAAMERSLGADDSSASVLSDPFFADGLARMGSSSSKVIMANPGRCMRIGARLAGGGEGEMMEQLAGTFDETLVFFGVQHSGTRLGVRARLSHLPDIGPLVGQAIRSSNGDQRFGWHSYPSKSKGYMAGSKLEDDFRAAVSRADRSAADKIGLALLASAEDDSRRLNNFAWALLTESEFHEGYDDLALSLSERSVEVSPDTWAYLDTLALAAFRTGNAERAVALAKRCLELADESNHASIRAAIAQFEVGLGGIANAGHAH